jgi:hypothetical protein
MPVFFRPQGDSMAKRATQVETGKTRFELRFDDDVFRAVQGLADKVGVSVNQLMQGIARWAVSAAHPGEFDVSNGDTHRIPGVVWFGRDDVDSVPVLELDFTERRVVRDDFKRPQRKAAGKDE